MAMSKELTKKLLDALVITILVAGAILILTSIHFFFFQRYPSSYTAPFMHRLSILALTIFAIAIATFLPVILLSFYKQKMDK